MKLLALGEIALLAQRTSSLLEPAERRRLVELVRQGRGRRSILSDAEREELAQLVAKAEPRRFAGPPSTRSRPSRCRSGWSTGPSAKRRSSWQDPAAMYPVAYDQNPPVERNRLTVFFRIFIVIPHFIVAMFYGLAFLLAVIVAWFAILFTGKYPQGLYDFCAGFLRFGTRLIGYYFLVTDEFPPFDGGEHPEYPIRVTRRPAARTSTAGSRRSSASSSRSRST